MSDTGYGDFEFERTFFVKDLPIQVREDDGPALIVQSYFLAADGYALRVRLQAPGIRLDPALTAATPAPAADNGKEPAAPAPAAQIFAPTPTDAILEAHREDFDFCALTAKGPYVGGTRYEAERELDVDVGVEMVRRGGLRIVKNRYALWLGDDGWVVDVFAGANAGLVLAECERGGPVTDLTIPAFCHTEVTDDPRFSNEALATRPWSSWGATFRAELAADGPRFLTEFGTNRHAGPEQPR